MDSARTRSNVHCKPAFSDQLFSKLFKQLETTLFCQTSAASRRIAQHPTRSGSELQEIQRKLTGNIGLWFSSLKFTWDCRLNWLLHIFFDAHENLPDLALWRNYSWTSTFSYLTSEPRNVILRMVCLFIEYGIFYFHDNLRPPTDRSLAFETPLFLAPVFFLLRHFRP